MELYCVSTLIEVDIQQSCCRSRSLGWIYSNEFVDSPDIGGSTELLCTINCYTAKVAVESAVRSLPCSVKDEGILKLLMELCFEVVK